jgi:aminoglycoside phosphotransferase (APT) family kinase protein
MMPSIDVPLAAALIAEQFPRWSHLAIRPIVPGGWDNRSFRLGDDLVLRLPSAARYVPQVAKEQTWLPRLAPQLPLPIPEPVAVGRPGCGYPWPWSINRWIAGETLRVARAVDLPRLADDLARFLAALHAADTCGAPLAGPDNFHRGGDLGVYDAETRAAVATLGDAVDGPAVLSVWDAAIATRWPGAPVCVHGDVAAGNLICRDGRLAAVIDFGSGAAGDPACDLVPAFTMFDAIARARFRTSLGHDAATWARARGWALWKALITRTAGEPGADLVSPADVIAAVLADHADAPRI